MRHCWLHVSCSTTLLRLGRRPRQQRSGVATSISSSLLPSTRRSMRGDANHQRGILMPQRCMLRPQPVRHRSSTLHPSGQMAAKRRGTARRWQVTRRPTSGPKSTVAVVEKMAESPSSADARGVGILRAAILKKISTLKRRHVGAHPHVRRIPLAPRKLRGGGGMALAPHLWMVVWPRKFRPHLPEKYDGTVNPAEFLQIYSTSILAAGGDEAIMANYFPVALTGTTRS
jgi:hypothetical protein